MVHIIGIHGDYGWQDLLPFHSIPCQFSRSLTLIQNIYSIRYEWVTRMRNEKPVKNRFIRCETLLWQHLLHFVTSREWNKEWWWNTNKCKYIEVRGSESVSVGRKKISSSKQIESEVDWKWIYIQYICMEIFAQSMHTHKIQESHRIVTVNIHEWTAHCVYY